MNVEERIEAVKAEIAAIEDHIETLVELRHGFPKEITPELHIIHIVKGDMFESGHSLLVGNILDVAGMLDDLTDDHPELLPLMEAANARKKMREAQREEEMDELKDLLHNSGAIKINGISELFDLLNKRHKGRAKPEDTSADAAPVVEEDQATSDSPSKTTEE